MDDAIYASGGADFIQADRNLQIDTPLGKDVILPERCEIREGVNSLFEFHIAVRSKKDDLQASDLIGKSVDISLELDRAGGQRRYWNGIITTMNAGPRITRGLRSYALIVRPKLWLLSQKSDCRIWQNKTSLHVLDTLLSEHGLPSASKGAMHPDPTPQIYSVQYNETDLDYLRRRLEEDGIFFWHKHKQGEHRLYVASHQTGYLNGDPMDVRLSFGSADRNHITAWNETFSYVPGRRTGSDWNFEMPGGAQKGTDRSRADLPIASNYELYEYPSRINDPKTGENAARWRINATDADHHRITGESSVRTLAPAERFKPYEEAAPNHVYEKHVPLDITHRIINRSYETNTNEPEYSNEFSVLPDKYPATPHRETKRPRIDGLQTAIIAGPSGEEIHTDHYGRIKLWHPWDRKAKKDGSDTHWVRVAQNWAGAQWGGQVIPRVGMEAMVAFVEGDPDRPIVVGLVPNPSTKVPHSLPANKTRMTMRSKSYQSQGNNELTFEDATGNENMFLNAQKDFTHKVLNNATQSVDANHVTTVGQNQGVTVNSNQSTQVGGSANIVVGGTGSQALGMMSQLTSLSPQTASMLQQAGGVASAASGAGSALSGASSLGSAASGLTSAAGAAGGGDVASMASSLGSSAMGFMSSNGISALQSLMGGSGASSAASGVSGAAADAGNSLRQAGGSMGQDLSSLFGGMSGVLNTVVGMFKNDSVGVAKTETVGQTKITNVGDTFMTKVGNKKRIEVGEELEIVVGKATLVMKKDGTVLLNGGKVYVNGDDHVQVSSAMIDNN